MNKAFHLPTPILTMRSPRLIQGRTRSGHVLSGLGALDRMTQLCLQESRPSVLEVWIFSLIIIYCM